MYFFVKVFVDKSGRLCYTIIRKGKKNQKPKGETTMYKDYLEIMGDLLDEVADDLAGDPWAE